MNAGLQSSSKTPFTSLLLAVFNSILEVFILCTAGYILARNGILDKKTQKQINRLNVSLFTPALLFSKVAFFLTPEKLKELWVIPIWFAAVTLASMLVGRVLGSVFRLRRSQQSFVMAAAMFMNSNALPIALMQSLVVSVPDLAWGPGDNKNAMLGRALTYLTMYSTLGMVVRYSYGVSLLSKADTINVPAPQREADAENEIAEPDERTPLLPSSSSGNPRIHAAASTSTIAVASSPKSSRPSSSHSRAGSLTQQRVDSPEPIINRLPDLNSFPHGSSGLASAASSRPRLPLRRNTTFYNSFPNSPNDSRTNLNHYDSRSASDSEDDELTPGEQRTGSLPTPNTVTDDHQSSGFKLFLLRVKKKALRTFVIINNFMTVPLWSAVASLLVACIAPLQHALEFHMQPVNGAINTAGKCAVPLTLVVLGAYFYIPPPDQSGPAKPSNAKVKKSKREKKTVWQRVSALFTKSQDSTSSAETTSERPHPGETKTVVLGVLARMIITPMLLVPFMVLATKFGWHDVFDDPVFVTVNTILLCSPPALTLAQITAAVSGDAFERLISRTIFWSYCIVTPPVTIGCVLLGLWLSKL